MAMSAEARALRKSNAVFKSGVDPENLVTVLYSNFLLTLDEREKATHKQFTAGQQLEEMFTALERRVAVDPHVLQKLLDALNTEPALVPVAKKIQEIYDEEKGTEL
jgi:predicted DNA-binding ArsR family transcriptional regulator